MGSSLSGEARPPGLGLCSCLAPAPGESQGPLQPALPLVGRGRGCQAPGWGGAWQLGAPSVPRAHLTGALPTRPPRPGWARDPQPDECRTAQGQGLSREPGGGPCRPSPDAAPLRAPGRHPHACPAEPSSVLPLLRGLHWPPTLVLDCHPLWRKGPPPAQASGPQGAAEGRAAPWTSPLGLLLWGHPGGGPQGPGQQLPAAALAVLPGVSRAPQTCASAGLQPCLDSAAAGAPGIADLRWGCCSHSVSMGPAGWPLHHRDSAARAQPLEPPPWPLGGPGSTALQQSEALGPVGMCLPLRA